MNDHDIVGCILVALIIFTVGFGIGCLCMYPRYGLSTVIENKLIDDAKLNYRPQEKHIGYIISNYYKEVQVDGNNN